MTSPALIPAIIAQLRQPRVSALLKRRRHEAVQCVHEQLKEAKRCAHCGEWVQPTDEHTQIEAGLYSTKVYHSRCYVDVAMHGKI